MIKKFCLLQQKLSAPFMGLQYLVLRSCKRNVTPLHLDLNHRLILDKKVIQNFIIVYIYIYTIIKF